ncbi:MAG: UDP-N-acetylglucosamine--N-acetylmuramyl-(pentapeptide) pyrophosphoryl-undecaprenol N-acetylglucosamine transferase [Verrucomicrobiota bacterium]
MATMGIACGGTGGHLFPGLAVAQELMNSGHEVRLYVSMKKIDQLALENYPELQTVPLSTIGFPGLSIKLFDFIWKFYRSYKKCCNEIKNQRIEVVLGMGGFSCAPLLLAASSCKVPAYLHESNAYPGKVTRLLAKLVRKVFIGMETCAKHLPHGTTLFVGTPIRKQLKRIQATEARKILGLSENKLTVGIVGGSQGAQGLNHMVVKALSHLQSHKDNWQFLHISGPGNDALVSMNYRKSAFDAVVNDFCQNMGTFYSACDVVVSRSGAASMAELSYYAKPSILIPYPYASENHQMWNAKVFREKNAAEIIEESESAYLKLVTVLEKILSDRILHKKMCRNVQEFTFHKSPEKQMAKELIANCSEVEIKEVASP